MIRVRFSGDDISQTHTHYLKRYMLQWMERNILQGNR